MISAYIQNRLKWSTIIFQADGEIVKRGKIEIGICEFQALLDFFSGGNERLMNIDPHRNATTRLPSRVRHVKPSAAADVQKAFQLLRTCRVDQSQPFVEPEPREQFIVTNHVIMIARVAGQKLIELIFRFAR